jgi:3-oxoacyl-[acyl-carrier protein] reductase
MMLTKTMAMELGPDGITVNAVSPGLFPAKDKIRPLRPEYMEAYLKSIPLGYFGEPADVADAVLFLASSKAHYITGEVLTIDGGCLAGRFLLPENKKA